MKTINEYIETEIGTANFAELIQNQDAEKIMELMQKFSDYNNPPVNKLPVDIIQIKAEFLFELHNKQAWINRVPDILPEKTRGGEQLIFVDKNGCVFETGRDFKAAEEHDTYPCKVYRPLNVATWGDRFSPKAIDSFKMRLHITKPKR